MDDAEARRRKKIAQVTSEIQRWGKMVEMTEKAEASHAARLQEFREKSMRKLVLLLRQHKRLTSR